MVSRIINPESSRSSGSGVLAAHSPAPIRTTSEKPEKKDPKILQKRSRAKPECRLESTTGLEKRQENEAKQS
jgi:hypothetical protein